MATFGELKAKVANRLQDPNGTAVSSPDTGDVINTAIKYWKQKRFWFNEHKETVTLTAGDNLLPALSTDLLYLLPRIGMTIPYQSYQYTLEMVTPDYFDAGNIGQRGRPHHYTWRGGRYELYYYPDLAYDVDVTGVRDYADLVNDSDTNDFTAEAEQLILYDALSRAFGELRTDPAMSDYYTNRTQDEYKNLKARTNKMLSTGTLHVDRVLTSRSNRYA